MFGHRYSTLLQFSLSFPYIISSFFSSSASPSAHKWSSFQIIYGNSLLTFLSGSGLSSLLAAPLTATSQLFGPLRIFGIGASVSPAIFALYSQLMPLSSTEKDWKDERVGQLAVQAVGWNALLASDIGRNVSGRLVIGVLGGIVSIFGVSSNWLDTSKGSPVSPDTQSNQ